MDERYMEQASAIQEHLSGDSLNNIQRALRAQGQSDCDDCGDPIPTARRHALPSAIRCINCQSAFDIIKKGFQR